MWEEYTPQEGRPYSLGTMGMMENGNRYSWVDVSGVHNEATSRMDRFRRLTPTFAAAPDMLEALQSVLRWAMEAETETGKPIGEGLGYRGKMQLPVAFSKVDEAIRKAIG